MVDLLDLAVCNRVYRPLLDRFSVFLKLQQGQSGGLKQKRRNGETGVVVLRDMYTLCL